MNNQNRWKSYVLWGSIASLVGMALMDLGIITDIEIFNKYVKAILYIAVMVGVINNPTDGNNF